MTTKTKNNILCLNVEPPVPFFAGCQRLVDLLHNEARTMALELEKANPEAFQRALGKIKAFKIKPAR